jgi:hypothetical protein
MPAYRLSVPVPELRRRARERLAGLRKSSDRIVWTQPPHSLLIHADTLQFRALDGWLLASLVLETEQTGRDTLQFVFFLGRETEGNGTTAACTINAPGMGGSQIADRWGNDLKRVLWDAVLDAIEASVDRVAIQHGDLPVTLLGFTCGPEAIQCDVMAGDR